MAKISLARALNAGLAEEMERDESVFLIGEDMINGAFSVTRGLGARFGDERVINTPLSESVIAGACVGAAMMGRRPVGEIMFGDMLVLAMDQLVNSAAKVRYCSNGKNNAPLVIRTANGGMGRGMGPHHNQSFEAMFAHVAGLVVVMPSSPADAKGLLKASIRCDDPVIFLESKSIYRIKGEVPEGDYVLPLGKCEVKREGTDLTLVATGAMVNKGLNAAESLQSDGIDIEVIDPRTLKPLDKATIMQSVEKTGRLVIVEEACKAGSFGAEVAATIAEESFHSLKSPIGRVAAPNTPIPANNIIEKIYLPDEGRIIEAVKSVVSSSRET
ncbi:MAG: alpha-ketoacid dehydrogenase subunit beta [Desulfobacteraceae bacterium]|nr:alpha-ketoacid dehydrogenase subunit beta [Desulfobacteraceae bacterium]